MKNQPTRVTQLAVAIAGTIAAPASQTAPGLTDNPGTDHDKRQNFANFTAAGHALAQMKSSDEKTADTGKPGGCVHISGYRVRFDNGKPVMTLISRDSHAGGHPNLQPAGFMSIGGARADMGSSAASAGVR